jgi:hypothetical protein
MEKSLREKINNFQLNLNNFENKIKKIKEDKNENIVFIDKSNKDLENLKKLKIFINKIYLLCNSSKDLENRIKLGKNKEEEVIKTEEKVIKTEEENKEKDKLITIVKNIKKLIKSSNKIKDIEKDNIKKKLNNLENNNNLISERLSIIRYIDKLIFHTFNKNNLRDLINLKFKIMEPFENNKIETLYEIEGIIKTHSPIKKGKKGMNKKYNNFREKFKNINNKIKIIKEKKEKKQHEFQGKLTELRKISSPKKSVEEQKQHEFQRMLKKLRPTKK